VEVQPEAVARIIGRELRKLHAAAEREGVDLTRARGLISRYQLDPDVRAAMMAQQEIELLALLGRARALIAGTAAD
jgi:hypothetical protein